MAAPQYSRGACWDDCAVLLMIIEMLECEEIEKAKKALEAIVNRRAPDGKGCR